LWNVLVESARIARGKIRDLKEFHPADFDGLLFPGGFGAAKNLSTWAFEGADAAILPEVEVAITGMVAMKKPVGALCISPVILARVLGEVHLTIGDDESTIDAFESDEGDPDALPPIPPTVIEYEADSVGALWNYILISEDMSMGIHNPDYAEALLLNSINALAAPAR
jgi:enhancing lycopene biosynthesis protein 2